MKKTFKSILLSIIILAMLITLVGCGGNTLVATKTNEDDGTGLGKYEEKIEIKFKKDKVSEVKMTYEFEEEETAGNMVSMFNSIMSMANENIEGFNIEQKGKKVIMKVDAETFAEQEGAEVDDMTKEALKKELEEEGYKVK